MKITNINNLPQPFVSAVSKDYVYKDKQYSATALLKGTCESILERRHQDQIENDVSDMIWAIFGTAVHSILENAQETYSQLKENKIVLENIYKDYNLSGVFDLYDETEKEVVDYKTASIWKVKFNDWEDYRKQLLIYAWMLEKIGFECKKGKIVALLKDHSKTKAKIETDYPKFPVHSVKFNFNDNDFKEIEEFILSKFKKIDKQSQLSDEDLEPCSEKERWHRGDKYKVKKEGRKTAIKNFDTEEEAQKFMDGIEKDRNKHYLEFVEGTDAKCEEYCSVKDFCPFYKKKVSSNGI